MTLSTLLRKPTALVPLALSLLALAVVFIHLWFNGTARGVDEGTAAHIFQLIMLTQVLCIGFFAITWLPKSPRSAAGVLALHLASVGCALTPVAYLGL